MKKLVLFLLIIVFLSGCGKSNSEDVSSYLTSKLKDVKSYNLKATLEIYRNEEKYVYDVDSSYKENDFYKVELTNKNSNHKQIILKNSEGVYVLTPSLNKSFKFQSDWPYNNSQIYLLQPIVSDIDSDSEKIIEKTNDGYIIKSKVNYSTEKDFKTQRVYLDKDKNITKIEVLDSKDNVKMSLNILNIDYNIDLADDLFDANKYVKENDVKEKEEDSTNKTAKIEDVVYPMYVPVDTYLSSQDVVSTANGERVILTFNGESAFTIVQETLSDDNYTTYVYGDPYLILDTVGSITDYSVSWISNGIEYSIMSDTMNVDELLTVAQSITVKTVGK